ncbi:MAG: S8 family serine peptidase, partial [Bacteroidota bacterium]
MKHVFSQCLKGIAGMILMLSCFSLSAQPHLNLHRGTIQLEANVDQFLQQPDLQKDFQQTGLAYRLIQFQQIPTSAQQRELANAGIKLADYLPEHTYLAVVSPGANLQRLQSAGVRAVYELVQQDRVTTSVWNQDFPPYALEGNEVWLQLALMPDLKASFVRAQLEAMESEVETISIPNRYARVRLPLHRIPDLSTASFLLLADVIQPEGEPEDIRGLSLHRSNVLNGAYNGARDYDGTGVSVAVRDDGTVGPHIDFQGRLDNGLSTPTAGTHGDRVAGVVGGFGNRDPTVQGMAPGSFIYAMDYQANFLDSTIGLHNSLGVMVTNSSYSNGCNAGYTVITNIVDGQAYDFPSLLHVFSGGNSNGSDCGYGAGNQWGNVTGGHKMGKNVLTVAALDISDEIAGFSSRGPAHDGRIKPDISGLGVSVRMPSNDNTYTSSGGTSFSAPGLAGISAQLYHAYRELNGGADPTSALIKATMLNTADDLGNVGPDFIFGWGRVNARQAVEVLEGSQYLSSQADQGDSLGFQLTVPANTKEARIMLYWAEEPSTVLTNKALINNLNLQVRDGNGQVQLPWVLDPTPNPANLDAPATNGIDTLNNMEQVILTDPAAGPIDVSVLAPSIPKGPQEFYLVYAFLPDEVHMTYPMGGESFVPGITERVRWDALGTSPADGTFTLEYSTDGGGSWQVINNNIAASARFYDWPIPNLVNGEVRMRISRGGLSSSSVVDFSIVGQPQNLTLEQVCPTSLTFSWDAVAGASEYEIFLLGEKY